MATGNPGAVFLVQHALSVPVLVKIRDTMGAPATWLQDSINTRGHVRAVCWRIGAT
jgi:hypothetical protein